MWYESQIKIQLVGTMKKCRHST